MFTVKYNVYEESPSRKTHEDRVTVQGDDCDRRSKNVLGQLKEICMRRTVLISCLLLIITVGLAAIYVLHFELQGAWNRDSTDLGRKYQQLRDKQDTEFADVEAKYLKLRDKQDTEFTDLDQKYHQLGEKQDKESTDLERKYQQLGDKHDNETRLLRNNIEQNKRDADVVNQNTKSQLMNLTASFEKKDGQLMALINENAGNALNRSEQLSAALIDAVTPLYTSLGWTRSGRLFYKCFGSEPVDYSTAQASCQKYHGRLASATLRDPIVVRNLLIAGRLDCRDAWIGFVDRETEGIWKWSDGGVMNNITTEWTENEPNDLHANEDCAHITSKSQNKLLLNDIICSLKLAYICEIPI